MRQLPVIFRRCTQDGEVLACFPTERHDNHTDAFVCYAHIGQHGPACPRWIRQSTTPATPAEYASLLAELRHRYETNDAEHVTLKIYRRRPVTRKGA